MWDVESETGLGTCTVRGDEAHFPPPAVRPSRCFILHPTEVSIFHPQGSIYSVLYTLPLHLLPFSHFSIIEPHSQCPPTPSMPPCKTLPSSPPLKAHITDTRAPAPPPRLHHSDLLRRLNPKHTTSTLDHLFTLQPALTEDLLESVDVPLTTRTCRRTRREFLCCDYNRDGDSWRSPWSNEFDPPLETGGGGADADDGGVKPSERVRAMEVRANEAFDVYRELYYEGGVSSVYFWDLEGGFAGVVLLKKGEF